MIEPDVLYAQYKAAAITGLLANPGYRSTIAELDAEATMIADAAVRTDNQRYKKAMNIK